MCVYIYIISVSPPLYILVLYVLVLYTLVLLRVPLGNFSSRSIYYQVYYMFKGLQLHINGAPLHP